MNRINPHGHPPVHFVPHPAQMMPPPPAPAPVPVPRNPAEVRYNITRRIPGDKKFYVGRFYAPNPPVWKKGVMKKVVKKAEKEKKDENSEKNERPMSRMYKRKRDERRILNRKKDSMEFRFKDNANDKMYHGTLDKPPRSTTYVMFEVANNNQVTVYPVDLCKFRPQNQVKTLGEEAVQRLEKENKLRHKKVGRAFENRMTRFNSVVEETTDQKQKLQDGVSKKSSLTAEGVAVDGDVDDNDEEKGKNKERPKKKRKKSNNNNDDPYSLSKNDLREGDEAQNEEIGDFDRSFSDDENDAEDNDEGVLDLSDKEEDSYDEFESDSDDGMEVDDDFDRVEKSDFKKKLSKLLKKGPTEKKDENDMNDSDDDGLFDEDPNELRLLGADDDDDMKADDSKDPQPTEATGGLPPKAEQQKPKDTKPHGKKPPGKKPSGNKPQSIQKVEISEKMVLHVIRTNKKMTVPEFLNKMGLVGSVDRQTKLRVSELMKRLLVVRGNDVKHIYIKSENEKK